MPRGTSLALSKPRIDLQGRLSLSHLHIPHVSLSLLCEIRLSLDQMLPSSNLLKKAYRDKQGLLVQKLHEVLLKLCALVPLDSYLCRFYRLFSSHPASSNR
ncbi:hypothetical protein FGO68_gene4759 [Halteria grandinella]|uniref:Uncharacterized protein n=1 Tax=Halteria grandinella TaxID=5974 RepID=A0A8J8NAF7_HALGN|nr:hypothetical protein FGO68_gene4759 [Halteria grandinella]